MRNKIETITIKEKLVYLGMLSPMRELWTLQNSKVYKSLKRGLQQAHEGKVTKVKDVKKFFEDL